MEFQLFLSCSVVFDSLRPHGLQHARHPCPSTSPCPPELFQILKYDAVKVLHVICQQIWKTQQWLQNWKRSVFIPIPKKGGVKGCSNYHTIALISHASKVILKILHVRFQQYMNQEFPDIQAGFRKVRGMRSHLANMPWIIEKAIEFLKNLVLLPSASLPMLKPLTVWITTNCGQFLKRWKYQVTLTCLLRNLYAGQEATVETRQKAMGWFKIEKGVHQGCILSPCLFNYMHRVKCQDECYNESQAGIKTAGRNVNNLRYADDTTLMAESEQELVDLLKKVKE